MKEIVMSVATETAAVRPFTVPVIPEADLEALRARVRATRWPDQELVADHSQGPKLAVVQDVPSQHENALPVIITHGWPGSIIELLAVIDAATANEADGQVSFRFHARDLHLVMGPTEPGTTVRFRVLLDGQPPGAAHGADTDSQGNGTATEQRLHQLIRQAGTITDRVFEITFLDPGVEVCSFTFG
jgi:hypothetical protein